MILKYKTHADPEFKVNRKGVLKQIYGPSGVTAADNHPLTQSTDSFLEASSASIPVSSSSSSLLNAIAPSRPAPLRIPSHPVVVDWHHLHDQLHHVKTSWLETAAHLHNPLVGAAPVAAAMTASSSKECGAHADSEAPATQVGVISGSLALFAITRLDVSENGICELPLALFQLNSLKLLNLGNNRSIS